MVLRVALFVVVFVASCSADHGNQDSVICSGAPVGDLRLKLKELNGRWYNKFFKATLGPSSRPNNVTIDFTIPKKSLKATEIVMGNNPADGTCLQWDFRDFQFFDKNACVAEKGTDPETCVDEQWVHHIFGRGRNMLFFFYCADANPSLPCSSFLARCLSRTPQISSKDIQDCQSLWNRFQLGSLPDEDQGSGNNACSTRR